MNNNPITKYPEGLDYLEKNMGTILFFPKLKILRGLRIKFIKSLILTLARQ
ncbi:MAG: hypothetical protein Q4D71_09120 [Oscillospiraceae bacterium]|nr:hypothetical protein [Oscillospiraceae bacterium]